MKRKYLPTERARHAYWAERLGQEHPVAPNTRSDHRCDPNDVYCSVCGTACERVGHCHFSCPACGHAYSVCRGAFNGDSTRGEGDDE